VAGKAFSLWRAGKESETMMTKNNGAGQRAEKVQRLAEIKVIHSSNPTLEKRMTTLKTRGRDPLIKRLFRWLVPDQRVANRHAMPPLIVYLGTVHCSKEYRVGDISIAGFYMITEDRWVPGTGFPVTLERTDPEGEGQTLTLHSTVVRNGDDGVGFTFVQQVAEQEADGESRSSMRLDLTKLAQFLKGLPLSEPESLERAS
jgi:hypothetical protein